MKSNIRFNLKFNVESNLEFNSQTNSASNFESLTLPSDMVRMIRMIRMRLHLEHSESRNIKRLTSCNFEIRWFPKTSESLLRRVCLNTVYRTNWQEESEWQSAVGNSVGFKWNSLVWIH